MIVLVTGSSGMIGRELCRTLLDRGHIVIGMDIQLPAIKHRNYIHSNEILPIPYDEVYCFTGFPCPTHYLLQPSTTMNISLDNVKTTLDISVKYGAKFILASSSEVYEDHNTTLKYMENDVGTIELDHPRSCYKELKRYLEVLVNSYRREHGLDTRIVRIFNTYGECHRYDTRLIPKLIDSIKTNTPLTVYGDGNQKRSYSYVSDTVEGILTVAESNMTHPVNVGNPVENYSVNEVIYIAERVAGKSLIKDYQDKPDLIGTGYREPDISRLKGLGFEPSITLEEGLSRLIIS